MNVVAPAAAAADSAAADGLLALEPQGQHNSIGNDPVKLTYPTQHASR